MKPALWLSLLRKLMLPMCQGGEVHLLRPIGTKRALELALQAEHATPDMLEGLHEARLASVRRLYPVRHLPSPRRGEWLLSAALNDLLVATHPGLSSWFGPERPRVLLSMALTTIERAGAPQDIAEALGRHALFGNVLRLVRHDTTVSWWTGSETFTGQRPPARLFLWPELRRVKRSERVVPLPTLVPQSSAHAQLFHDVFARWLRASPLSDLAELHRAEPRFQWTGANLGLIATPLGRTLALRAIEWNRELGPAFRHAEAALARIPQALWEARSLALEFKEEIELRERALSVRAARASSAGGAPQSRAEE